ncbi:ABC transporter substrate-binding protein [Pigmentiphaga sp. NML080357]|uniref:ABC transporter substrate-binding protein n=1 Tax=Pigmentiphaga sp. NML080357 TaxID=2008675 RepID=UPI000B416829|nr:ABC transporter substrate-binding protein [Pigmentiphaga sp. NML080357]OVZ60056.1 ABC transporter substrate-binding protein [Pigmentiphaga sp. NML080357]
MYHRLRSVAAAAALFLGCGALHAQAPIKIGFMGELTGPQAAVGQDQLDGFMLLVERNGGKLGGYPVEVIREDTQLKPDVANQAARRLVEREKVPIVTGISFSNVMLAVHRYLTEREVFVIGSNAGPSQIAGPRCSPYQFMTSWQGDQASEAVGQYATDQGYKRVVVLAPNYQAGKDTVAGFKRYYKSPLADELYTSLQQLDFSTELAQAAARQPDAVFAFFPGGLGVSFAKQYAQSGLKDIPLLSTFTVDAISLPVLGDSALGMITGGFWAPDFANAQSRRFVQDFERRYRRIPSNYAAQSYDAALLLDSAIAKVQGRIADKPAFMAALKQADFQSVRGEFRFNNNHFPLQDMHVLQVARDGQGRLNLKTLATPFRKQPDAYHRQCPLS